MGYRREHGSGPPRRPSASRDIDILTTKRGAYAIDRQLKRYETKRVRFRKSPLFQSYLGEFKVSGVKVQVMGDLRVKVAHRWLSRAPRLKNPRLIWLGGYRFPVVSLRKQLESYKALSRRKSKPKIKKIQRFLTTTLEAKAGFP